MNRRFDGRRYDANVSFPIRCLATGLAVLVMAACQPVGASVAPSAVATGPGTSIGASPSEPSASAAASSSLLAGQTDTAWGRIWDSVPAGFPTYPGATPAEEAATGPASAVLAVPGVEATAIADWMQSRLEQASYRTESRSGPLEDGSYVLESTGSAPGCRVEVSVAPLGGLTTLTVRYGATCPRP